jgi:hypothetical protein
MRSPTNACIKCQSGKRRCDRKRPSCSTCHQQSKECTYLEDEAANISAGETPPRHLIRVNNRRKVKTIFRSSYHQQPFLTSSFSTAVASFRTQAMAVLDSSEELIPTLLADFFATTWKRLPYVSKGRLQNNLSFTLEETRVEILLLYICIEIITSTPKLDSTCMITEQYIHAKNLLGLLEMAGELSLDLLHCRLLLAVYELGHGIHTPAYLSIATCGKIARAIGLHKKPWQCTEKSTVGAFRSREEEKRLWWAVVNIERFLGLSVGDAMFVTCDSASSDYLPITDSEWELPLQSILAGDNAVAAPVLATATTVTVGQLARECQVSHLAGRVVRHVNETTKNSRLHEEEAEQLERTLKSFLPMLAEEELKHGRYCGALGICHRYVFQLYCH